MYYNDRTCFMCFCKKKNSRRVTDAFLQASPHYYKLGQDDQDWNKFLETRKAAVVDMRCIKPRSIKNVKEWSELNIYKPFIDDIQARISSGDTPDGRIRELFQSAHLFATENPFGRQGSLDLTFVEEVLTAELTVYGNVFVKGQNTRKHITFRAGTKVFRRVAEVPQDRSSCTMDIRALMFQLQAPHEVGVPILYSTAAGTGEAITRFSFVKSCYNRWPYIKVFGKDCCVAQLVCLLQFGLAPRRPQRTGGKGTSTTGTGRSTVFFVLKRTIKTNRRWLSQTSFSSISSPPPVIVYSAPAAIES